MPMKQINLNDWIQSGESTFGLSYFHKSDETLMLKLAKPGADRKEFVQEYETACRVYELGVPSPEPGELVTCDGLIGILFRRIVGKRSIARAIADNPDEIPQLARIYSDALKKLHSTPCNKDCFRSIKDVYRERMLANPFRSDDMKAKAVELLESLPDADTCVHGDMHFGNIIIAGGKYYFIDLGSFSYGYPLFDFAMLCLIIVFGINFPERFINDYHCTPEQAIRFRDLVIKEYFGPDTDIEQKLKEFEPYMTVRLFDIEMEMGSKIPEVVAETGYRLLR